MNRKKNGRKKITKEWKKEDWEFVEECKKNNWYYEYADDGFPILCSCSKSFNSYYHLAVWNKDLLDVDVAGNTGHAPNKIRNMLDRKNIPYETFIESDSDIILLVDKKYLKKLVIALNLKRKKRPGPGKKTIEKLKEANKKRIESAKKNSAKDFTK